MRCLISIPFILHIYYIVLPYLCKIYALYTHWHREIKKQFSYLNTWNERDIIFKYYFTKLRIYEFCIFNEATTIHHPTLYMSLMAVLEITIICHILDLWKFTRSYKPSRLLCPPGSRNLPGTAFKAHVELWIPLSETVLSSGIFVSNTGPVNIWNYSKAQK